MALKRTTRNWGYEKMKTQLQIDPNYGLTLGSVYNQFALQAGQSADAATKQVFEALVNDEEGHYDQFDKQLENIKRFGLSYLALQSFEQAPAQPAAAEA